MYCTVYLVVPVSADGLGIVFGCLTIKLTTDGRRKKQTTNDIDILTDRIYSTLKTAAMELLPYQKMPKSHGSLRTHSHLLRFGGVQNLTVSVVRRRYRECCKQVKRH